MFHVLHELFMFRPLSCKNSPASVPCSSRMFHVMFLFSANVPFLFLVLHEHAMFYTFHVQCHVPCSTRMFHVLFLVLHECTMFYINLTCPILMFHVLHEFFMFCSLFCTNIPASVPCSSRRLHVYFHVLHKI